MNLATNISDERVPITLQALQTVHMTQLQYTCVESRSCTRGRRHGGPMFFRHFRAIVTHCVINPRSCGGGSQNHGGHNRGRRNILPQRWINQGIRGRLLKMKSRRRVLRPAASLWTPGPLAAEEGLDEGLKSQASYAH